jgi:hypothetical protein
MPISIAGSGTITGISAGGLPDNCITTAEIAANAVTTAKLGSAEASGLAKAWVNFNGTGTVAIRASYNVSSITDNGTGDYTVNFTSALVDANYSIVGMSRNNHSGAVDPNTGYGASVCISNSTSPTTTAVRIWTAGLVSTGAAANVVTVQDQATINVAIFR